jgi:hypothetical protein
LNIDISLKCLDFQELVSKIRPDQEKVQSEDLETQITEPTISKASSVVSAKPQSLGLFSMKAFSDDQSTKET